MKQRQIDAHSRSVFLGKNVNVFRRRCPLGGPFALDAWKTKPVNDVPKGKAGRQRRLTVVFAPEAVALSGALGAGSPKISVAVAVWMIPISSSTAWSTYASIRGRHDLLAASESFCHIDCVHLTEFQNVGL